MKPFTISVIFVLFVFISCTNSNNKFFVEQINSLEVGLNNAYSNYNKFDSLEVSLIRNKVKINCRMVSVDDSAIISKTLITYGHIDKSMKQIIRMNHRIMEDYSFSKSQLEDLKYDISNDHISDTIFKQYFEEEKKIVMSIIERMEYNTSRIITETNRFDSLNPIIENYFRRRN